MTNQEQDIDALLTEVSAAWEQDRPCKGGDLMMAYRLATFIRAERAKNDPTRVETPDAKRDAVDDLLDEAERGMDATRKSIDVATHDLAMPNATTGALAGHARQLVATMERMASALRAERTRADGWRRVGEDNDRHAFEAIQHLRAVIAWQWPSGTKPAPVRAAELFLDCGDIIPDTSGPNAARYAIRCEKKRANEAEEEATRLRADLATLNKLHEEALRERDKLEAALSSERDQHAKTEEDRRAAVRGFNAASEERVELRAKLQAEEEAHANTRAEWDAARAQIREIFDAFEFTLGDPARPEHVAQVVAEARKQCRMQDTVNALETRLANITRNPFAYITPKNEAECGILESVRTAVKGNSGNGAAMIFDLLVHATRVAGERADQLARLAAADEKSFADLAVMAERSWKEQAPFASVKIAFEWGFVRGAQTILGEPAYAVKGGA